MFETADTTETDLLPEDLSSNWCNLTLNPTVFNANKLPSGSAYAAYDASYFAEAEVNLGHGNSDTDIDILDLVLLNKTVTNKTYNANFDLNEDGLITDADMPVLRKHILGVALIG